MRHFCAYSSRAAVALVITLSACAQATEPTHNNPTALENEELSVSKFLSPEQQVVYARNALAVQLGQEAETIGLPSVRSVVWRSGALGCPQPNTEYTQALQRGILIVFKHNGEEFRYHAAVNGEPFYCPAERAEPESTAASDI